MIIQTRSGWLLILSSIKKDFERTLTDTQKTEFVEFCNTRFKGYTMSTETMGEVQTAVYLMLEFCKLNGIVGWKQ